MRDYFPLSKTEEGIFVSCLQPTDAYNLANVMKLGKELDVKRFVAAVSSVFEAHPYLFTVLFEGEDGRIYKKIRTKRIEIPVTEQETLTLVSPPFTMLDRHLFRLGLYRVKGEYYFLYDFHHIIFDGTSIKIFADEVAAAYEGKKPKKEVYTANDFAADEEKRFLGKEYKQAKAFFETAIADSETDSSVIFDRSDGKETYKTLKLDLKVKNDDVKKRTRSLGVKTSSFFLGAFGYLLAKINMEDKALFLTVHNGRNEFLKNSMGMFVKTFPLYIEKKETVDEYLKSTSEQLKNATGNLTYPFSDMVKDLGVSSSVMFAYQ